MIHVHVGSHDVHVGSHDVHVGSHDVHVGSQGEKTKRQLHARSEVDLDEQEDVFVYEIGGNGRDRFIIWVQRVVY